MNKKSCLCISAFSEVSKTFQKVVCVAMGAKADTDPLTVKLEFEDKQEVLSSHFGAFSGILDLPKSRINYYECMYLPHREMK